MFRAFHQMGKERELIFLRMLPFYGVGLLVLVGAVFFPDAVPIADWWNETFGGDEKSGSISKPAIGLIMLAVMLFSIFHRLSDLLHPHLSLAFVFGTWGANFKLATFLMALQTNSVMLSDQSGCGAALRLHGDCNGKSGIDGTAVPGRSR